MGHCSLGQAEDELLSCGDDIFVIFLLDLFVHSLSNVALHIKHFTFRFFILILPVMVPFWPILSI